MLNEHTYVSTYLVQSGDKFSVDPHVLVIATTPIDHADYLAAKPSDNDFMRPLINDVFMAHRDMFSNLDFAWGPTFYRGWTVDVSSPKQWRGLIDDGAGVRPVLSGRFNSSIAFHAQPWPAAPNPRGKPNASAHPVEGIIRKAAIAHVYLTHRYLCGWFGGDRRYGEEIQGAASIAMADLLLPLIELTALSAPNVAHEDIQQALADRLIEVSYEESPSFLLPLHAGGDPKSAGAEMARLGSNEMIAENLQTAPTWLQLNRERLALVDAWRRAKDLRKAQENARRDTKLGTMSTDEALPFVGIGLSDLQQLTGIRPTDRTVRLQDVADLARRYEIDITAAFPKLTWARPVALAFAAVGALIRRGVRPDLRSLDGCITAHSITSYASNEGQQQAAKLGFDANWPQAEFQAMADMIGRNLPRHPPFIPGI